MENSRPVRVRAVVTNYNGGTMLSETVEALLSQRFSGELNITVVDDCSTDDSLETFKNKDFVKRESGRIEILKTPENGGVAKAYNFGIRPHLNDSDYILKIDNDLVVQDGCVEALASEAEKDKKIGIVGGKVLLRYKLGHIQFVYKEFKQKFGIPMIRPFGEAAADDGQFDLKRFVLGVCGPMMLFRTELFHLLGLFDESYGAYGWEDIDFELLTWNEGHSILYQPAAVGIHAVSLSGATVKKSRTYRSTYNRMIFMRRFFRGVKFWEIALAYTAFLFYEWVIRKRNIQALIQGHFKGLIDSLKENRKADCIQIARKVEQAL